MKFPFEPIFILFSLIDLVIGALLVTRPDLAIEIQRKFYAKINWKIEPISLKKELRNTRIMGCLLVILLSAMLFFLFAK